MRIGGRSANCGLIIPSLLEVAGIYDVRTDVTARAFALASCRVESRERKMNLLSVLLLLCGYLGYGIGLTLQEAWRDRREKSLGLVSAMAMLFAWPVYAPLRSYRAGRIGLARFRAGLIFQPLAAFILTYASWGLFNLGSYQWVQLAAQRHLETKNVELAFEDAARLGRISANLNAVSWVPHPAVVDGLQSRIAERYVDVWRAASAVKVYRLLEGGRKPEAKRTAEDAVRFVEVNIGTSSLEYARALMVSAYVLEKSGDDAGAESALLKAASSARDHQAVVGVGPMLVLSRFYARQKRIREALTWEEQAAPTMLATFGPDGPAYKSFSRELSALKEQAAGAPR